MSILCGMLLQIIASSIYVILCFILLSRRWAKLTAAVKKKTKILNVHLENKYIFYTWYRYICLSATLLRWNKWKKSKFIFYIENAIGVTINAETHTVHNQPIRISIVAYIGYIDYRDKMHSKTIKWNQLVVKFCKRSAMMIGIHCF